MGEISYSNSIMSAHHSKQATHSAPKRKSHTQYPEDVHLVSYARAGVDPNKQSVSMLEKATRLSSFLGRLLREGVTKDLRSK
jgi:hypothetical protein